MHRDHHGLIGHAGQEFKIILLIAHFFLDQDRGGEEARGPGADRITIGREPRRFGRGDDPIPTRLIDDDDWLGNVLGPYFGDGPSNEIRGSSGRPGANERNGLFREGGLGLSCLTRAEYHETDDQGSQENHLGSLMDSLHPRPPSRWFGIRSVMSPEYGSDHSFSPKGCQASEVRLRGTVGSSKTWWNPWDS